MTWLDRLKSTVTGALVGLVTGPIMGGLLGAGLLALAWSVQGWWEGWPTADMRGALGYTVIFGLLLAPVGASVGGFTGTILGAFPRRFYLWQSAVSFGGILGGVIGLATAPGLFGGETGDATAFFVAVLGMIATGSVVALLVKRVQRYLRNRSK